MNTDQRGSGLEPSFEEIDRFLIRDHQRKSAVKLFGFPRSLLGYSFSSVFQGFSKSLFSSFRFAEGKSISADFTSAR
jgi:hypothetical protein